MIAYYNIKLTIVITIEIITETQSYEKSFWALFSPYVIANEAAINKNEIVYTIASLNKRRFLGKPTLNQIIYSGGGEPRIFTSWIGKSILWQS